MNHILSVDLEDWQQLAYRRCTGELPPPTQHVVRQAEALLALLHECNVQATFFVLGMLAEQQRGLVRRIAESGHEVASHGYAHRLAYQLSREQFVEDTKKSKDLLEEITGKSVSGYRAAEFSVREGSLWVLEALAEIGFTYDSSVFPIRHRRYGISGFYPHPARFELPNGTCIIEIPPATVALGGRKLPAAGGGYFRLLPQWALQKLIAKLNQEEKTMVTYLHPYEFDPQPLRIFETARPESWKAQGRGLLFEWHQNLRRSTMPVKLASLLRVHRFTSCEQFLKGADLGERRKLFPAAR